MALVAVAVVSLVAVAGNDFDVGGGRRRGPGPKTLMADKMNKKPEKTPEKGGKKKDAKTKDAKKTKTAMGKDAKNKKVTKGK